MQIGHFAVFLSFFPSFIEKFFSRQFAIPLVLLPRGQAKTMLLNIARAKRISHKA
jgi:hypothetical protein